MTDDATDPRDMARRQHARRASHEAQVVQLDALSLVDVNHEVNGYVGEGWIPTGLVLLDGRLVVLLVRPMGGRALPVSRQPAG